MTSIVMHSKIIIFLKDLIECKRKALIMAKYTVNFSCRHKSGGIYNEY